MLRHIAFDFMMVSTKETMFQLLGHLSAPMSPKDGRFIMKWSPRMITISVRPRSKHSFCESDVEHHSTFPRKRVRTITLSHRVTANLIRTLVHPEPITSPFYPSRKANVPFDSSQSILSIGNGWHNRPRARQPQGIFDVRLYLHRHLPHGAGRPPRPHAYTPCTSSSETLSGARTLGEHVTLLPTFAARIQTAVLALLKVQRPTDNRSR